MTRFLLIILIALAVAACGYGQTAKHVESRKVVYRSFPGEGMCKPGETIIAVFCDNPDRFGEVIAPSSNDKSRAIGTCSSTGEGTRKMTLVCERL